MVKNIHKNPLKNTLKSMLAFGVFVLFISQSVFTHIYFELERMKVKKAIKQKIFNKIPEKDLKVIIRDKNFDKDEFWHNNQMYDVVRKEFFGDSVILFCFEDNRETELAQKIEEQIHSSLDKHPVKKQHRKLLDFLKLKFIQTEIFTIHFFDSFAPKPIFLYQFSIISSVSILDTPPPIF